MQLSDMLSPSGKIIAVAAGSITTALGGHVMVSYGINIPPDAALTIPAAAGLIAGHVWDVMTRQPIPDPTQGQMTPPPMSATLIAGYQPTAPITGAVQPPTEE